MEHQTNIVIKSHRELHTLQSRIQQNQLKDNYWSIKENQDNYKLHQNAIFVVTITIQTELSISL